MVPVVVVEPEPPQVRVQVRMEETAGLAWIGNRLELFMLAGVVVERLPEEHREQVVVAVARLDKQTGLLPQMQVKTLEAAVAAKVVAEGPDQQVQMVDLVLSLFVMQTPSRLRQQQDRQLLQTRVVISITRLPATVQLRSESKTWRTLQNLMKTML
jgi:hypothetical protein